MSRAVSHPLCTPQKRPHKRLAADSLKVLASIFRKHSGLTQPKNAQPRRCWLVRLAQWDHSSFPAQRRSRARPFWEGQQVQRRVSAPPQRPLRARHWVPNRDRNASASSLSRVWLSPRKPSLKLNAGVELSARSKPRPSRDFLSLLTCCSARFPQRKPRLSSRSSRAGLARSPVLVLRRALRKRPPVLQTTSWNTGSIIPM